ncbi:hypothetical protein [Ferrovibrio sp.]|uniref:hypothetical protein n=1 Tax=Ferrovibrio sp. TaxID=1917215 RepID=UPI00311EE9CA
MATTPLFVSLFTGILAWSISHLADRVIESPSLLYSSTVESLTDPSISIETDPKTLTVRLQNLSRDKTFKNVEILLTAPAGSSMNAFRITPTQPAHEGNNPQILAGLSGRALLPEIQPNWKFDIVAEFVGETPSVRISAPNSVMRLIEPGFEATLAKNEFGILVAVVFAATLLGGLSIKNNW